MFYPRQEKRQHPRYSFKAHPRLLPTIWYSKTAERKVHAVLQDLSRGGVCLRADHSVKREQIVRCELSLPGIPVAIPTLMRVRWTRRVKQGYMIGMQFVV